MRGMKISAAKEYAQAVLEKKRCIPMVRFNENCGRTPQAKEFGNNMKGRWPVKSVKFALKMIRKAEANAHARGLDTTDYCIYQFHINRARGSRRRAYGAHGRIKAFNSKPCHLQIILAPAEHAVRQAKGKTQYNAIAVHHRLIKVGTGALANLEKFSTKEMKQNIANKVKMSKMRHMSY